MNIYPSKQTSFRTKLSINEVKSRLATYMAEPGTSTMDYLMSGKRYRGTMDNDNFVLKSMGGKIEGQITNNNGETEIKLKVILTSVIPLTFFWGTFLGAFLIISVVIIYDGISSLRVSRIPLVFIPAAVWWLIIYGSLERACRFFIDFLNEYLKE